MAWMMMWAMIKDGFSQSFLKDTTLEFSSGLLGNLLVQDEIANLFASNEVPQLLQHFLSLGSERSQWVNGASSPAPGLVAEALNLGRFVGGEAQQ
jgi:hypothetical protein